MNNKKKIKNAFIKSILISLLVAVLFFLWQTFLMRLELAYTLIASIIMFVILSGIALVIMIKAKNAKHAYIFDMDGTLVDSVYALEHGTKDYLDSLGLKYPHNIIEIITPLGYEGAAKYLQKLGVDLPTDEITKIMKDSMLEAYETSVPAKPHAKELLKELKSNGHTVCLLTASPHFLIAPCFERLCLTPLFDHIWSTDDFGMAKSNVMIYHEVAKKLGKYIGDCTFVDDNINNIKAAKKAGMHTVAIYDEASKASESELKDIAEKYIYSFDEF